MASRRMRRRRSKTHKYKHKHNASCKHNKFRATTLANITPTEKNNETKL